MKFNFKKISAIAGSLLLTGLTMGTAMAANYPAPFVSGGTANVAIVYGTGSGVSSLDLIQAGNIQTDLQSYMGSSSGGTTPITNGEIVSLDTSSTRIWLNSSLNLAKSTLTKADLPTVLADTSFSGDVDATFTQTIKPLAGSTAGGEHSSKVWFGKQPTSSDDPVVGISIGGSSYPLYNATVTFNKAVNFSDPDSEGETITLFGKDYVISTATDTDTLVLFSSAEEVTLSVGGSNPVPSKTITIDGTEYTVELISASDTSAWVSVNGESKEINEGASKKVSGIDIAVKTADESTALSTSTASLLVGSDKLTFEEATTVTEGSDNTPIEGTKVYLPGTVDSLTGLTVEIYKPSDPAEDTILPDMAFTDPVFGSFKVDFQGMSSPLDDSGRENIVIQNSGDDKMQITMTDSDGNDGTFTFAYNHSGTFNLSDGTAGQDIRVREMANLSLYDYSMIGIDDYGHLVQVITITNSSSSYSNDVVKFQDVLSDDVYSTVITQEGQGTLTVDGKAYTVTYGYGSGEDGWVQIKYPTTDSIATGVVLFPTIQTANGAKVAFVEPIELDLGDFDGAGTDVTKLYFPDGDGWGTGLTVASASDAVFTNWTINGVALNSTTNLVANVTVGDASYYITRSAATDNKTVIGMLNVSANANLYGNVPAADIGKEVPNVLIFEGKNDDNEYNAISIDLEAGDGSSTDGVGVNDVDISSKDTSNSHMAYYAATMYSDSDIEKELDWYGTLVTSDSSDSDQKSVTISYPNAQIYANVFIGEEDAVVTSSSSGGATSLGEVLVTDAEVSSVATKNLIVVGGSCINSAAATLVGGAYCGAAWTEATGAGSGQFVIKGYASSSLTSKVALLVAGYEAADTVNAATYLRNKKPDTSKEYLGTSSTSAELVVE